jgi:ATP-dependent DNA helicase RecG
MRPPTEKTLWDWAETQKETRHLWGADDIYARADRLLLETLKEDRRIERKPARIHADLLGDYFSMWANTSPEGGLIAVGVADSGKTDGCHSLDTVNLNKLEKAGYVFCPEARCETKRVPVKLDDGTDTFILLIRVYYHPTRVVETVSGKVFVRIGDSKIELKTDEQKQQLRTDKGEIRLEQEPCGLPWSATQKVVQVL